MIDFYLKIEDSIKIEKHPEKYPEKPYSLLKHYFKYVKIENESYFDSTYYYSNSFWQDEHPNSIYSNESELFILFGNVYYRNYIKNDNYNALDIETVYNIVKAETPFHKSIKGNFSYVLIDKRTKRVELVNSPFGVIPINFSIENGAIYISSSLSFIKSKLHSISINKAALVQVSMFDTILGNNTLISEIEQLQFGQRVIFYGGRIIKETYYDHTEVFNNSLLSRKESIKALIETIKQNSRSWPQKEPFLMGLTGGYDCRLNFSLIPNKNYKNIIAYTYGMSSSMEITIANKISKKYKLRHEVIELEEEFEKEYIDNANEVIKLSDGFTPFMRVNYFYAHRYLSQFAKECITGMYGSEYIKPMHVMEDSVTINPSTVKAFFSKDILESIKKYFYELKESDNAYFTDKVFDSDALEKTLHLINNNYIENKSHLNKEQRIFNFYLNEGMRKFFMELIRVDKMFVNHNLPYLDFDFLELLLSSMYAGVNNHIFNESIIKRRKGQLFYADAMNILNSELNNIPVDRGYKPKHLRNKLGWFYITFGYIFGKKLRKWTKGNTTFNTKKWRSMVYEANQEVLLKKSPLFKDDLNQKFHEGYHLHNEHVFGRHFSIKKWLDDNNLI